MIQILPDLDLRTLNYGTYGRFLIMGHAGFISSTGSRELMVSGFRVFRVQGLAILGFRACIARLGYFQVLSKPSQNPPKRRVCSHAYRQDPTEVMIS